MDKASSLPGFVVVKDTRVLLRDVEWSTYVKLRDASEDRHLRMTYLQGALEIMTPGRRHEVSAKQIARLLEMFCLEHGIPLYGYRSTTLRRKRRERGLEPDECYARGRNKAVPDVALEVVVSVPLLDKLDVYRGLGVREVWVFQSGAFAIHRLRRERYVVIEESRVFPELDLRRLAYYARKPDQNAAVLAFCDELRRKG